MADNDRDELLGLAREHVGTAFGLTSEQSARLRGATKAEIEADAKAMRAELGLDPIDGGKQRERDEQGRFASNASSGTINSLIRRAAGRSA
jgi:hypothetical protein